MKFLLDDEEAEERKELLMETGLFQHKGPFRVKLKGTLWCYMVNENYWWIERQIGTYSFEQALGMIENHDIKLKLLFHLDLF